MTVKIKTLITANEKTRKIKIVGYVVNIFGYCRIFGTLNGAKRHLYKMGYDYNSSRDSYVKKRRSESERKILG